jgi:hypothetical protein
MPLWKGKSKKAFSHNVKVEYKALRRRGKSKGKAMKQAVAIAYRQSRKKS